MPRLDVRAALAHMHDLPYLQMHPLGGLRGKDLRRALDTALAALGESRRARLLRLRYAEGLDSREVARRLGISQGEYYREHSQALEAFARVLDERVGDRPPAAGVPHAPPGGLPRALTGFVGREQEIGELVELLAEARLVTLTGPGGTGKTRLAIEVARRAAAAFPDGTAFVELGGVAEAGLVPAALAAALGAREQPGATLATAVHAALRDRGVLIVLDNCEHLLAACTEMVEGLLRACPLLRIVATSRAPLQLYGEHVWPVRPLALPDGTGAAAVFGSEAGRLFLDRAGAAEPGFLALADGQAAAVAQLCRQLDGLPLAIELAAARVRVLPPAAMLAHFEAAGGRGVLDALAGAPRARPAHQQTLRDAVDWSHGLLSDREQTIFRRLAVFAGPFTVDQAGAVCQPEGSALDLVESLVHKSLLASAPGAPDAPRFRLLRTIREYALERLEASGEAEATRGRLVEHLAATAPGLWRALRGVSWSAAVRSIDRDLENVRAALGWCVERGYVAPGLRIAGCLSRFWSLRGLPAEGREWLLRLLSLPGAGARNADRVRALVGASTLSGLRPDWGTTRPLLEEALAIAEELGDDDLAALVHVGLGLLLAHQGEVPAGRAHHEASLAIRERRGERDGIDWALLQLGRLDLGARDYARARTRFEEALALAHELGDEALVQMTLSELGHVAYGLGEHARARDLFAQSLARARAQGNREATARLTHNLGFAALELGDLGGAGALLRGALRLQRQLGAHTATVLSLGSMARLAAERGQPDLALRFVGAAEAAAAASGLVLWPNDQARRDRAAAIARAALSPSTAEAALAEGRTWSLERAVAAALADPDGERPEEDRGTTTPH